MNKESDLLLHFAAITLESKHNLNDLLLALPLPTPSPGITGNQSLLSHLRVPKDERMLSNTSNSSVIPSLIEALSSTTVDHIELKDCDKGEDSCSGQEFSELLQCLLRSNPNIFKDSVPAPKSKIGEHSGQWLQRGCLTISSHSQQQQVVSAVSLHQPRQTQDNKPNNNPLEHTSVPQGERMEQNKILNVMSKSTGACSSLDLEVPSRKHQDLLLPQNEISQETRDSSALQENPQILNSSLVSHHIANESQSSNIVLPSNDGYVDEVHLDSMNAELSDRIVNPVLLLPQNEISQETGDFSALLENPQILNSSLVSHHIANVSQSSNIVLPSNDGYVDEVHLDSMNVELSDRIVNPVLLLPQNEISQETRDFSPLQENPQILNSSFVSHHIANVSQSSNIVLPSNDGYVDEVHLDSMNAELSDRIVNPVLISPKATNNVTPNNLFGIILENFNEISISSSSSSLQQHNNSSNITADSSFHSENCMKNPAAEQWQSVSNNSFDNIQSESFLKENVKNLNNLLPESYAQLLAVPGSEPNEKKGNVNQIAKYKAETESKPAAVISEKMKLSVPEPVVVLTKLSLEDQLLAQKNVRQFIMKSASLSHFVSPHTIKSTDQKKSDFSILRQLSSSRQNSSKKSSCKECYSNSQNSESCKDKGTKRRLRDKRNTNYSIPTNQATKRQRISKGADYVCYLTKSPAEPLTPSVPQVKILKSKSDLDESFSVEDMHLNIKKRFSRSVDVIFNSMEDIDLSAEIDEDAECAVKILITLAQLQELSNNALELKKLLAMNKFPIEKLVRLLAILKWNIVDGSKLLPLQIMEEQDEEERFGLELTMARAVRSVYAALTALHIMTSPKMPKIVFLEEVIERIVLFLKNHLQNFIFPAFDPAYRLVLKSKDGYAENIKQKRAHSRKDISVLQLCDKLCEAIILLAELVELQTLTDSIIFHVSTIGVSPIFVESTGELKLNALRLLTNVFARYDRHRQPILQDILASIARLPTSKRNLRNYRLNSEGNIQMLTALVLQLIHSVIRLPELEVHSKSAVKSNEMTKYLQSNKKDAQIITSYGAAVNTATSFLSVFLKKCAIKKEEMDYRPLFENFVQDLLTTVYKPEWPASELLLFVLGHLFIRNLKNKSTEMSLRVASLDYLGIVAARLRKDAVTAKDCKDSIKDVIRKIETDTGDADLTPSRIKIKKKPEKYDDVQILQKALLQYLDSNASNDPTLQFSRRFYIAHWYKDVVIESKSTSKYLTFPKEEAQKSDAVVHNKAKADKSRSDSRRSSIIADEEEAVEKKYEKVSKIGSCDKRDKYLALAYERKHFLLTIIKIQQFTKNNIKSHIQYEEAELISRYLASSSDFSKSFELYLSMILRVLSETAIAIRTKAIKCLNLVVEDDPNILARTDVQKAVEGRLLDHSTSVREAAVDLLGKFILTRPELINQYYEMLASRIRDTGVSVRKRVIKILRDICLKQPDFPKIPEICVKIIGRINDEDGIKKLVFEFFQTMWFNPASDKKQENISQKVKNITRVVEVCRGTGLEWFEQLLSNLQQNKEDDNYESVVKSCKRIIDCLVENLLPMEESSQNVSVEENPHLVACFAALHLFSKIHPTFIVPHVTTILRYLSVKSKTHLHLLLLQNVAQTLENVVPFIEHPSQSLLAQIEEDMVKLILREPLALLPSCVSCLSTVVNKVTQNYQLVKDCVHKFFNVLLACKRECEKKTENQSIKSRLLRSLYTVGVFCGHFDFEVLDSGSEQSVQISLKDRVFEGIIYFTKHDDKNISLKALSALGCFMTRHHEFMLYPEVETLYHYVLTSPLASPFLKCQVLKNVTNYLVDEERKMREKDAEWSKTSKSEEIKKMGDVTLDMTSTVIQVYLQQILECVSNITVSVRRSSLSVIQHILGQGLAHPVQIVPHLICLGSDDDPVIRTNADQLLLEISKKHPNFILMKAVFGVRMSFKLQQLVQDPDEILRGFRCSEAPESRNSFLYSVLRSARQSRRTFMLSLLKLFDEQARTPLTELLYVADNIAYFPYMVQDEPLFIINQLDMILSIFGSNLLQMFRESLLDRKPSEVNEQNLYDQEADDDENDFTSILERLPEELTALHECITASQGCALLLYLKQTLKIKYCLTDNKIHQYSPNETVKAYERPLNRKDSARFVPETVLKFMETREFEGELVDQGKENIVNHYLNFKNLMMTVDLCDDDDNDGGGQESNQVKPVTSMPVALCVPNSSENSEIDVEVI